MQAKVSLLARINQAGFPFVSVRVTRRGIALPVEYEGRVFGPDDLVGFYARYSDNGKRHIKPLGKDPVDAYARFQNIERDFTRIRAGLLPLDVPDQSKEARQIAQCVREFEANLISEKKKARSIESYMGSINSFLKSYTKESIDDVTERDILNYLDWMEQNLEKRNGGHPNNTYRNKLRDIKIFLKYYGVSMPLSNRRWPKEVKKAKRKYSTSAVNAMLKVARTEDEKDLVHFLLKTGFRDEEVAHAQYGDINWRNRTINVSAKTEYNWTPKNNKSREQDITLETRLFQRMQNRRKRYNASNSDLIFPSKAGRPNQHLIRIIQRLVKRAELEVPVSLHQFRKTFGTEVAKRYGLEQARIWLGHEDIATTQAYLAADEMTTSEQQTRIDEAFSGVGD